jgi:hypothetical protein
MIMAKDDRDILDVLKTELEFIEKGGYGRSVRTPWRPSSLFLDSLTCINYEDPSHTFPCENCLLIDFVGKADRSESVPCHKIPLNEAGMTLEDFEQRGDEERTVEAVKEWLINTIKRIEEQRAVEPA